MSSVPTGKRSWKCPECGSEVLLSITQLDPIACEACVTKMKGGGSSAGAPSVADAVAGPLGIWSGLPETTKLAVVVGALLVGLVLGYFVGQSRAPKPASSHHSTESTSDDEYATGDDAEQRPKSPGPDYKWIPSRKHRDGTQTDGHWAKIRSSKSDESSGKKAK